MVHLARVYMMCVFTCIIFKVLQVCSVCIVVAMDNCFRRDMVFLLSYAHLISIIILKASVLHW